MTYVNIISMEVLLKGLNEQYPENESIKFLLDHRVQLNFVLMGYIADSFQALPTEKFYPHLMSLLDSVVFFYQKYQDIPAGGTRVKTFHQDVNEIISQDLFGKNDLGDKIICSKGCSSCCSQLVSLTPSEGELLLGRIHTIDRERLQKQANLNEDNWTVRLTEADGRCVFLNSIDGSCSVWMDRPANCRNYFVMGANSGCSVFKRDAEVSRSVKSIYADVCISAFYSLEGGTTSMSSFLHQRLL